MPSTVRKLGWLTARSPSSTSTGNEKPETRQWNPKWLEAMKDSGYAGARQMFREVEHLYGFQATTPQHIDESIWQETPMRRRSHPPPEFPGASASLREGLRRGRSPAARPFEPPPSAPEPDEPRPEVTSVTGFEMEQEVLLDLDRAARSAGEPLLPVAPLSATLLALLVGAGIELRRRP